VFLKKVLKAMHVNFTVQAGPDGEWMRWVSRGAAEEREIRHRVSQYAFIKMNCKKLSLPSPETPARPMPSC